MRPFTRVALFGGLATLLLSACADRAPIIREVDHLRLTDDPHGPFQITARISPGDGDMVVRVLYVLDERVSLDGPCSGAPPTGPQRTGDVGPPDAGPDVGPVDGGPVDGGADGDVPDPPDAGLPDAGAPPAEAQPGCYAAPMVETSAIWTGRIDSGPFPLGARILYRIEAIDEDGDRTVWPSEGAASIDIDSDDLTLVAIAPDRGPAIGGTEVLLRGDGFGDGLAVLFGDRRAEVTIESAQLATVVVPPGAPGPVEVRVLRAGREAAVRPVFVYEPPPTIERVDPAEAPADTPLVLIVDGERFLDGALVQLGDLPPTPADLVDARRIVADLNGHPAGIVDVTVINGDGQPAVLEGGLILHPPPRLDAIEPGTGPDTGGTRVQLTGGDFRRPVAVWFGDRRAASARFVDAALIEAIAPRHPDGLVDVTVYNVDGQSATLAEGWRFIGPPRVDEVDPGVVGRCGGALATLRGRNFEPDMQVTLGGRPVEVLEVAEDGTEATVRLPRGAVGPARLEIVGPDGRVFRSDDLFSFDRRPIVRAVEPRRIPIWGQDDVVVTGADLDAVSAVSVGGVPATGFTIVAGDDPCDGRLLVDTPSGEDGPADLQLDDAEGEAARLPDAVEYVAPRLEPAVGLQPGYTNVEMVGVGLVADLTMTLGDRAPRTIERISDERWRIVTPAGGPGPVALRFALARVGRQAEVADGFTYRSFRSGPDLDAPGDCNDVSVADLNGDDRPDVAAVFGGIGAIVPTDQAPAVYLNVGDGRFRRDALVPTGNGINGRLGDADGDGDLDLLVANLSGPQNRLFLNNGDGTFRDDGRFAARDSSYDADFIDVDGDGDLDVFSLRIGSPDQLNASGPEQLFLNDGTGRFTDASDQLPHSPGDVHDHDFDYGDVDGDGDLDIVIAVDNLSENFRTARNRLWLNRGDGTYEFAPSPFNDVRGDWLDVKIVDVDGDGDQDVLMPQDYLEGFSFPGTPAMLVYLNDGAGQFVAAHDRVRGLPRLPAYEVVPHDLDADGDLDLLVGVYGIQYADGTLEPFDSVLLLNDGTATWFEATSAFDGLTTIATSNYGVADFDGDGDLDLFECAASGRSRFWVQE